MRHVLLLALLALPMVPPSWAQEREPQDGYMVHMDLSVDPPRYVPDELVLLPGGVVQLMLFGKGAPHSLTLDATPAFDADVTTGVAEGFYERSAQFSGPTLPGAYAFHDKHSGAKGVLVVRARDAAPATIGVRENGYDLHFAPERLVVAPGATVTFRANGSFAHTLTSATDSWNDSALRLAPGGSGTFAAPTTAGEYPFFCRYHAEGGMRGVLVVEGSTFVSTPTPSRQVPLPWALGLAFVGAVAVVLRRRR